MGEKTLKVTLSPFIFLIYSDLVSASYVSGTMLGMLYINFIR